MSDESETMKYGPSSINISTKTRGELQRENEELRKTLRSYGGHKSWCESFKQDRNTMGMGLIKRKCNCGFEQALKVKE